MTITELTPQEFGAWDQFVRDHSFPESLTQTSQWPATVAREATWPGDFFIVTERDEGGNIVNGARVDVRELWLRKRMWWVRGKFNVQSSKFKVNGTNEFYRYLIHKVKQEEVIFIRFQSEQPPNALPSHISTPRFLVHVVDPEKMLLVDLHFAEEELLSAMHEKTRYNMRLAEKHGVTINQGTLDEFYSLYQATNARKRLRGYPRDYFEKLLRVSQPLSVYIFIAKKEYTPIAGSFLMGFGATCTYLFGGSNDDMRNLMAPHLLHWESMRCAKRKGYQWYDFGGISDTNPSWQGITKFKRGFVSSTIGREINHGKTYDLIIQPRWYSLFALAKRLM